MNAPCKNTLQIAALALLCLLIPLSGNALAADAPATPETAPPRTVADIIKVLEHYKPDPAVATKAREAAAAQPPASTDRLTLLRFYVERARAAVKVGNTTQQITDLRTARQYMQRGEELSLFALGELATAEAIGGNIVNASAILDEVLGQIPDNMRGMVIGTNSFAAQIYAQSGNFEAARKSLAASESAFQQVAGSRNAGYYRYTWMAQVERGRAEMFAAEGKLVEAEAAFRKVLRERELDKPMQELRLRTNMTTGTNEVLSRFGEMQQRRLAQILLQLGRLGEAELNIRASLKSALERVGRDSVDTAVHLVGFAFILLEQGRFQDATLMAREALKSAEAAGASSFSRSMIFGRKALGAALVAEGKWDDALAAFDAMKAGVAGDAEIAKRSPTDDIDWATALLKKGRAEEARVMLARMLERSTKQLGERDNRSAQIRAFHAIAIAKLGQRSEALAQFGKAVPILIEQARSDIAADTGGLRQVKRLTYIIESYLELMSAARKAGLTTAGLDTVAESFRLADVARGSQVQRALAASAARASISDPALADLARREQDLQRRVNTLSDLLKSLLSQPPEQQLPKIIADLRRDIDAFGKQRSELKRDIEKRFPDYAELTDPKPTTPAQAQAALAADEALISIYVGESKSYVWVVPKNGEPIFNNIDLGDAEVTQRVALLRRALDFDMPSLAGFPRFDLAQSYDLYSKLLQPVERGWRQAKNLIVVPHGALGQLPFAVLTTAPVQPTLPGAKLFEEYRQVPWLIRSAAITQLPSVGTLVALRRMPVAKPGRREFIGFGDPLFSNEMALVANNVSVTRGVRMRNLGISKTATATAAEPTATVAHSAVLAQLARLQDTAEEINSIARVLKADPATDVFLGRAASEKNVKSGQLENRRIVMFATHGLVPGDLNGLTQPALALSAPEVTGNADEDGLLTMEEVLGLKLNADWVVLSACNTASGDGAGTEAVSGLGKAFFFAGARTLLVSNWPVETVSARLLTTKLFEHQGTHPGDSRAAALRATMLELLDHTLPVDQLGTNGFTYAHPMFWAPFSLVGDGGR